MLIKEVETVSASSGTAPSRGCRQGAGSRLVGAVATLSRVLPVGTSMAMYSPLSLISLRSLGMALQRVKA